MIHHVQLACPPGTEEALRAFYGGVLGMTEKHKPPVLAARGGCWFVGTGTGAPPSGPAGVAPGAPDPVPDIELHLGVETDFRPARKAHPGLLWPALDELAERLAAAGYPVDWSDELPGYRRFYSADPNGNRLEFLAPDLD